MGGPLRLPHHRPEFDTSNRLVKAMPAVLAETEEINAWPTTPWEGAKAVQRPLAKSVDPVAEGGSGSRLALARWFVPGGPPVFRPKSYDNKMDQGLSSYC